MLAASLFSQASQDHPSSQLVVGVLNAPLHMTLWKKVSKKGSTALGIGRLSTAEHILALGLAGRGLNALFIVRASSCQMPSMFAKPGL